MKRFILLAGALTFFALWLIQSVDQADRKRSSMKAAEDLPELEVGKGERVELRRALNVNGIRTSNPRTGPAPANDSSVGESELKSPSESASLASHFSRSDLKEMSAEEIRGHLANLKGQWKRLKRARYMEKQFSGQDRQELPFAIDESTGDKVFNLESPDGSFGFSISGTLKQGVYRTDLTEASDPDLHLEYKALGLMKKELRRREINDG